MSTTSEHAHNDEVSGYANLLDEVLLNHVIPKLSVSDRVVLSRVDRRTCTLVELGARGEQLRPRVSDFVNSIARLRW
jgi:hypothetical protein